MMMIISYMHDGNKGNEVGHEGKVGDPFVGWPCLSPSLACIYSPGEAKARTVTVTFYACSELKWPTVHQAMDGKYLSRVCDVDRAGAANAKKQFLIYICFLTRFAKLPSGKPRHSFVSLWTEFSTEEPKRCIKWAVKVLAIEMHMSHIVQGDERLGLFVIAGESIAVTPDIPNLPWQQMDVCHCTTFPPEIWRGF